MSVDFNLVAEQFPRIPMFATRADVEELLGPPSVQHVIELRFASWEENAEHMYRDVGLPRDRVWEKWIDPNDEDRWVAILFADGKVYYKGKKGFDEQGRD